MLYLRAFGGLALENGGRPIVGAAGQRSRLAILAVLATAGDRPVSRDRLVAVFWPDQGEESAHGALRQALYALRRDTGERELTLGTSELRLNPAVIGSDVLDFDVALRSREFDRALERYTGPLLDGIHLRDVPEFERWADDERERRLEQYRAALKELASGATARGEFGRAGGFLTKLAASDPLSASSAVALMKALVRADDHSAALRHAREHERFVRAELDAAPDPAVVALAEDIRASLKARRAPLEPPSHAKSSGAPVAAEPAAGSPAAPVAPRSRSRARLTLVVAAVVVMLGTARLMLRPAGGAPVHAGATHPRTAIAVLPVQNLSAEPSQAWFAAGLHDELLTQLSKVAGLKVTDRQSVMGYAGPNAPTLKQVAADLEVGSVVELSVQVVGNRLRVTVQLVDVTTDAHVWAEQYDRTLDDALAIESDVARQIVTAVGAVLTAAEDRALSATYTKKPEAYLLYLQGREYRMRPGQLQENVAIAQQFFERAIALDPEFALAHAALSEAHGLNYLLRYDRSAARAARQREEAETALRLAPDLPQAHLALGSWHYQSRGDYPRALAELRIALDGLPNDVDVWARIGQVTRRMGKWDESAAAHEKTTQLSPRRTDLFKELGVTYLAMRRYADAASAFDRALSLAPDFTFPRLLKGLTYARWTGRLDTLRAAVRFPEPLPDGGDDESAALDLLYWDRKADSMLRASRTAHAGVFIAQTRFLPASLYAAWAQQLRGHQQAARFAFDSARVLLDSAVRVDADDERVHAARGLALAGLGRREEAMGEARWLQRHRTYRNDQFLGRVVVEDRARILAQVGDAEAALDEIEGLLARPSQVSVQTLRLDPAWDPIRSQPRFRALLARYASR